MNGIGVLFLCAGAAWVLWKILTIEDAPPVFDDGEVDNLLEFPISHVRRAPTFYDQDAQS